MHLVYSSYDGGYYWERYSDWKTSQVFKTKDDAVHARNNDKLEWE